MEVEIFTLCDYADNANGKLTIVGTFDSIYCSNFPANQQICALALRLRFSERECGKHEVRIRLIDQNQNQLQNFDGEIMVGKPKLGLTYNSVNLAIRQGNLRFDSPGKYSFELYIDNEWRSGLPLNLVQVDKGLKAA